MEQLTLPQDSKEKFPIFLQAVMQSLENNQLELLFSIFQWNIDEIIYCLSRVTIIFWCVLTGSLYV